MTWRPLSLIAMPAVLAMIMTIAISRRAQPPLRPGLSLPCRLDLGEGDHSAILEGRFFVSNSGGASLSFAISPSWTLRQ